MVRKKYTGEKEIQDKIKALFEYRKLTTLIHKAGLNKISGFVAQLTELQYRIYLLDAYLESNWVLEKSNLKSLWDDIIAALIVLVPSRKEATNLLNEIREYERIEKNCRKNKWPTQERFKKFYTTKSCDVRLIRHLIYKKEPSLQDTWKLDAWANYDLITEINDDIADLHEDLRTYNGNRFLISILRKGNRKTAVRYAAQLESITEEATKYFRKHGQKGEHAKLLDWTLSRSDETIQLLESTIHKNDHSIFSTSLMLEKME